MPDLTSSELATAILQNKLSFYIPLILNISTLKLCNTGHPGFYRKIF